MWFFFNKIVRLWKLPKFPKQKNVNTSRNFCVKILTIMQAFKLSPKIFFLSLPPLLPFPVLSSPSL